MYHQLHTINYIPLGIPMFRSLWASDSKHSPDAGPVAHLLRPEASVQQLWDAKAGLLLGP